MPHSISEVVGREVFKFTTKSHLKYFVVSVELGSLLGNHLQTLLKTAD